MSDRPVAPKLPRVPNTFIPEREVLVNHWLPIAIGPQNAVAYADFELSILDGMFPGVLNYGPHVAELRAYFDVFASTVENLLPYPAMMMRFQKDLREAYLPAPLSERYMLQQYTTANQLGTLVPSAAIPHLPRMFTSSGYGPNLSLRHRWSHFGVTALNLTDSMLDAMGVILGVICLQYAYLDWITPAITSRAAGRDLVRNHNRVSREWGFPELIWAQDNRLGLAQNA